ncbi:MAG: HAD family hydrolase [Acidimicrobiales bacterium]
MQSAAFFDLDKTVITKASMAAFTRPLRRERLINRRTALRAAASQLVYAQMGAGEARLGTLRETLLSLTKGWDRTRVRQIVRETLLQTVEPLIYAEALDLMTSHHEKGERVYLVSASPEEVVLPMAELLGADGTICSQAEVDRQGRYTGKMAFFADGASKARAIASLATSVGIDLGISSAYSDSAADLPMLELVGRPVAVNPDRALVKLARERGWERCEFTKPVRLRDRIATAAPLLTTMTIAAAALAVGLRRRQRAEGNTPRTVFAP